MIIIIFDKRSLFFVILNKLIQLLDFFINCYLTRLSAVKEESFDTESLIQLHYNSL
ncbi:MAG: hypothetical protein AB4426_13760 [Xenococcaceae cyanobacterium]